MNYRDLPESLKDRVEVVCAREELEFVWARNKLASVQVSWPGASQLRFSKPEHEVRALLIKRIKAETLAFAHEVCLLAKDGHVKARDIPHLVDGFLDSCCFKVSPELPPPLPSSEDPSYKLSRDVRRILEGTPEWDAHLTEKLKAAEAQADETGRTATPTGTLKPAPLSGSEEPSSPKVVTDDTVQSPVLQKQNEVFARERAPERETSASGSPSLVTPSPETGGGAEPLDNKARVDHYTREVEKATGKKITRKQISQAAGYGDKRATEFGRWQRNSTRTTRKAREKFEAILRDKPHLKNPRLRSRA